MMLLPEMPQGSCLLGCFLLERAKGYSDEGNPPLAEQLLINVPFDKAKMVRKK